ncbi:hypothetical protein MASR2M69_15920 [Bacteroidota bacterium]
MDEEALNPGEINRLTYSHKAGPRRRTNGADVFIRNGLGYPLSLFNISSQANVSPIADKNR